MTRIAMIRAEIQEIERRLASIDEDKRFHPWIEPEAEPRVEALRTRIRKLRQQEFMLRNHSVTALSEPMPMPMPLHAFRQNGRVEQQPSFMVGFLVFFALICIVVVTLMAAAGVLT